MTIECYISSCKKHSCHEGYEGPFCFEQTCILANLIEDGQVDKKPLPNSVALEYVKKTVTIKEH